MVYPLTKLLCQPEFVLCIGSVFVQIVGLACFNNISALVGTTHKRLIADGRCKTEMKILIPQHLAHGRNICWHGEDKSITGIAAELCNISSGVSIFKLLLFQWVPALCFLVKITAGKEQSYLEITCHIQTISGNPIMLCNGSVENITTRPLLYIVQFLNPKGKFYYADARM